MRRRANDAASSPPPTAAETRTAALRLLGRRGYTTAELRSRLIDRGHVPAEVDGAVARLVAEKWLDDRQVAAVHVRTGSRVKGRGRLRLRRELEARGVSPAAAREALDQVSPEDEAEAIRRFLAKRHLPAAPTPAERRRVFQQLLRRGFSADAIAKVLRYRQDEDA